MSNYIWVAGKEPRTMHLEGVNRLGRRVGALCGVHLSFDRSCNMPLGHRVCRNCERVYRSIG